MSLNFRLFILIRSVALVLLMCNGSSSVYSQGYYKKILELRTADYIRKIPFECDSVFGELKDSTGIVFMQQLCVFNELGQMIESVSISPLNLHIKKTFEYDEFSNLKKQICYVNHKLMTSIQYSYSNNKIVHEKHTSPNEPDINWFYNWDSSEKLVSMFNSNSYGNYRELLFKYSGDSIMTEEVFVNEKLETKYTYYLSTDSLIIRDRKGTEIVHSSWSDNGTKHTLRENDDIFIYMLSEGTMTEGGCNLNSV